MNTIVVIAICSVFFIILVFVALVVKGTKQMKLMEEKTLAEALPREAKVIALEKGTKAMETGITRKVELKLTLEIQDEYKGAYTVTTLWLVDEIAFSLVQPGHTVKVKVNSRHPDRVYPNVDWAEFSDWKIVKDPNRASNVLP
jgi:hypothetical protein